MSTREENNNPNQDQNQNQNQNQNPNQNQQQGFDQNRNQQNPNEGFNQNPTDDFNQNPNTGRNAEPFKITGNWGKQSSQLKEKYNQLTDSDLKFEPGKENQLLDQIGTKLNKSRDEVIDIINKCEV